METIEEAAEKYATFETDEYLDYTLTLTGHILKKEAIKDFLAGANWQKEQDSEVMYTEEEVLKLCENLYHTQPNISDELDNTGFYDKWFKEWIEQNKKK